MTWYPSSDDVLKLHLELVDLFAKEADPIVPAGARDMGLLASACSRPQTALGTTDKYLGIERKAAALFHSLVKNHPFHNGNKRTALVTLIAFLWHNDRRFKPSVTDDEVYDLVLAVATNDFPAPKHGLHVDDMIVELGSWVKKRVATTKQKPASMKPAAFLRKCEAAGVKWKESGQAYVIWTDKDHSVRFSRSTKELAGPVVREYLNQLGLTDIQVAEFQVGVSDRQVELLRFRNALRRLAHS